MKNYIKKIIHPFYKRYHFWYHKKPRKYYYKNSYTIVQPRVFSPVNTISTKVFLDYIDTLDLKNKQVLELGCGSGIMAVHAASKGARVTASDINKIALESLIKVSKNQKLDINCVYSDLFDNIDSSIFDFIFINPPFYPRKPNNIEEQAWFCGENFEYFKALFNQLKNIGYRTKVLMVLSNDCDFNSINLIANQSNFNFEKVYFKKSFFEENTIYKIAIT